MLSLLTHKLLLAVAGSSAGSAVLPGSLAVVRLLSSISWDTQLQQCQQQHARQQGLFCPQQQQRPLLLQQPQPTHPAWCAQPFCQLQQLWPAQQQQLLLQPLLLHQQQFRCVRTRAGKHRPDASERHREHQRLQHQKPHQHPQHQHQRGRAGQQYSPNAVELNALIRSASNPRELLERVVFNHEHLNHTHIITALQRATQLWPQTAAPQEADAGSDRPSAKHLQQQAGSGAGSRGQVQLVGRQQLERLMLQLSGPFIRALPDYSARDIASALWSYAVCHLQPPAELMHAALQELYAWDKLQQAQPSAVVNLAWAVSRLGYKDKQLFSHIAVAALSGGQMQRYTPAQLSSLAWALSRAVYEDRALGLSLTARAVELLQRQQGQQQQKDNQASPQGSPFQQSKDWQFTPYALSNVIASSATMGWLRETPELIQLAAELAPQEPFVRGFRPMDAANFLWGLATALREPGAEQHAQQGPGAIASREGNASAANNAAVIVQDVWQASLRVAAAALRRVDEANAGNLCRMVWATAMLSKWVEKRLTAVTDAGGPADVAAAQQAIAEGRVVFDQLCSALGKCWQQQPHTFGHSVAMTTWALIAADNSGLWRLNSPGSSAQLPTAAQQQQAAPPTLLLQRLLVKISAHGKAGGHQQQPPLAASTVADLAVALTELKPRVESYGILLKHAGGAQSRQGEKAQQDAQQGPKQQEDLLGQLMDQLSAAVDVLAAAAWQHAGTPGALEVRDVSRMLTAFTQLQVDDSGLYRDLLQHWTQEALQGCSSRVFVHALAAAATFTAAESDLVQSGSLPVQPWEHLLAACQSRWSGLSADEQWRARGFVLSLCSTGLKGVVSEELLCGLSELVAAAKQDATVSH